MNYRADIDGLRGIAILLVVVFHAFPQFLPGGYTGVDIFFVISGYIITYTICTEINQQKFSVKFFFAKRIRRIFPALIVVLLTVLALGYFALPDASYHQLANHVLAGVFFFSNFQLLSEVGYFDTASDLKPLLHLWSLAIEEQFYFLWPLILLTIKSYEYLIRLVIVFIVASFSLNIWWVDVYPSMTFYLPLTRFWELMVGGLCAIIQIKYQVIHQKKITLNNHFQLNLMHVASCCGVALTFFGAFSLDKNSQFPGWLALIPVIGTLLLIIAGPHGVVNRLFLSQGPLLKLGLVSYSLYLWHWPILSYFRVIRSEQPGLAQKLFFIGIAILLSFLTYRYIEKPARRNLDIKQVVLISLMGMLALVIVSLTISKSQLVDGRELLMGRMGANHYNTKNLGYVPCSDQELVAGLPIDYCFATKQLPSARAALIGDSHADDKFHGLAKLFSQDNWLLLANGGCPPLYDVKIINGEGQENCFLRNQKIINWLVHNSEIDRVVISFFGNHFHDTPYPYDHLMKERRFMMGKLVPKDEIFKNKYEIFYDGLSHTIEKLLHSKKRVMILIDIPELPFSPKDCLRQQKDCSLSIDEVMSRQADHRKMINRLSLKYPEILVFDPLSIFCHDGLCDFKYQGQTLYRDSHHLTLKGSDIYAKSLGVYMHQTRFLVR